MRKNFYGRGNDAFTCEQCRNKVQALSRGSYRNHCPECLYSKHVDIIPGDRLATCRGSMKPVGVEHSGKKGWIVVHQCERCRLVKKNKSAEDDNFELLCSIAAT